MNKVFLLFLLFISCNGITEKTISTTNYKHLIIREQRSVDILHFYPAEKLVAQHKKIYDLYVCKEETGTIIYIFDEINRNESEIYYKKGVVLNPENVKIDYPKMITISVPKDFILEKNSLIAYANLTWLLD
ncbi:hypothetical protein GM921_08470 [Pedobacter sp. LMG 31464]|uniref:Uncharacterized protein n=1 Tax=Pedobacter planticolens TaxID=2679964 RepID=A0A923IVU2_9SPHI|nr:hypothetical protein [Pedobacter planticolens]MBB2145514.1 hypothetical protein [Pedobacter planticolens]